MSDDPTPPATLARSATEIKNMHIKDEIAARNSAPPDLAERIVQAFGGPPPPPQEKV